MKRLKLPLIVLGVCLAMPLAAAPYRITERGADYAVWTPTEAGTNEPLRGSYKVLETGMHYLDEESGRWCKSVEQIEVVPGGAVARQLPYKVRFGATLAVPIEVTTPDNKKLKFQPLGLMYYDFFAEKYVTFAEATNSVGQLVSSNQVLYPGAIQGGGILVDVLYTVRKAGIEQDYIIRRPPDRALPEHFNFNPIATRLLAATECLTPPSDVKKSEVVRRGWKQAKVARIIDFGTMKMGHGAAFMLGEDRRNRSGVPVEKHWQVIDGRTVLLEEISFRRLAPMLGRLQASAGTSSQRNSRLASSAVTTTLVVPKRLVAAKGGSPSEMRLASADYRREPGLVIDFALESGTGITLRGDETYVVAGTVNLTNAVIEGGTCIKYYPEAQIDFYTPPEFRTKPYAPAIFTAVDDDSAGLIIEGSTGVPIGRYARTAIFLHAGGNLENLRILHAEEGVYCASSDYSISHSQILFADRGLHTAVAQFTCNNVLMNQVLTNFYGTAYSGQVQHLTSHESSVIAWDPEFNYEEWCQGLPSTVVNLLNSIVVSLTNGYGIESTTRSYVHDYATADQVFVSSAGGHHYLREDSPSRNSGSPEIHPDLAVALRQKTTTAPQVFTGIGIDTPTVLSQRATRGQGLPSRGYHYEPLDYVFAGVDADANITFRPGTAVGWYRTTSGWQYAGHGIHIADGQTVQFDGRAEAPCYWVRCNTVQELDLTGGYGPGGITGRAWPDIEDAPQLVARFTRFSAMVDSTHFRDDSGWLIARLTDCELFGAAGGGYNTQQCYTNCLLERVSIWMSTEFSDSEFTMRNCTMAGGVLNPTRFGGGANVPVVIRDCAFDGTQILNTSGGNTSYDYNATLTNAASHILPSGAGDIELASFDWERGPLGDFYLPSTSPLINTGSVAAATLGLYHFTTQTNQTKEATSVVDIGFHRVAVDASGLPVDWDGDKWFDYLEDSDGDGAYNTGDPASWLAADTDSDGVDDFLELIQGRDPKIDDSQPDSQGVIELNIHTPMQAR